MCDLLTRCGLAGSGRKASRGWRIWRRSTVTGFHVLLLPVCSSCADEVWACWQWPQGKERGVEDLKARYYTLARQLLIAREGGDAAVANHVLVKQPYNAQQERCELLGIRPQV